jgi:predicted homoserine dehydrogenase-like protein
MDKTSAKLPDRRAFLGTMGLAATAGLTASAQQAKPLRVGLVGAGGRGSYLGATIVKFAEAG